MFWPIVLPSQISFCLFLLIFTISSIVAQRKYRRGLRTFAFGVVIAILGFVPCCIGVQTIMDPYRFGVFMYPDFQSVHDFRIERYLPESAINITVCKEVTRYRAKFTISKQALDDFFERQWKEHRNESKNPREAPRPYDRMDWFNELIVDLGWKAPADSIGYEGPRKSNGAGFTLLYSASEGVAYQLAGYW